MDRLDYSHGFSLLARFFGGLAALLAQYVEPNAAVWLASGGAAFLGPAIGRDRSAWLLVRHILSATLIGIFAAQIITYFISVPEPPTAFMLAWIGPDLLAGVGAAAERGEFGPRAIIGAVIDHIHGRGGHS